MAIVVPTLLVLGAIWVLVHVGVGRANLARAAVGVGAGRAEVERAPTMLSKSGLRRPWVGHPGCAVATS